MPITPLEMERELLKAGWVFKDQRGSHKHYVHPHKPGKVTIPFHRGTIKIPIEKRIREQAGLLNRNRKE